MAAHNQLGKEGEQRAIVHLEKLGYNVLDKNWKYQKAEIDIIAKQGKVLIFVEVKARSYKGYKIEEWGIDEKKKRLICDAAYMYMMENEWEGEFRFDVITVLHKQSHLEVEHYQDVFFPGINGF